MKIMEMKELLEFIHKVNEHFMKVDADMDIEKHTLLRSMKLTEEVGELYEQILTHYGHGRKEKLEKYSPENLEHEMADVLFAALMIAKSLNIDVEKAMTNKMKTIKDRLEIE